MDTGAGVNRAIASSSKGSWFHTLVVSPRSWHEPSRPCASLRYKARVLQDLHSLFSFFPFLTHTRSARTIILTF